MISKPPMDIHKLVDLFEKVALFDNELFMVPDEIAALNDYDEVAIVQLLHLYGFSAKENLAGDKLLLNIKIPKTGMPVSISMKSGALKLVKDNLMPEVGKQLLSDEISKGLIKVCMACLALVEADNQKDPEEWSFGGEQSKLVEEFIADPPVDLSASSALKLPKVALAEAEHMYQPVGGSSASSVYHCIGKAGPLRFGVRSKGQALSIRVEGPVNDYKDALVMAGFNESYIHKGYTSVHFNGLPPIMTSRTVGAVLAGTGLTFDTPLPELSIISEKGE